MLKQDFVKKVRENFYDMEVAAEIKDAEKKEKEPAKVSYMSMNKTEMMINSVIKSIVDLLKDGDGITLQGFGTFGTKVQKGREGVIFLGERKGETYSTPDKIVPYFKLSKTLKKEISKDVI